MAHSHNKLEQALKDLIEAYAALEQELEEKHGDDEDAFSHEICEALETAIETAIEDSDSTPSFLATLLSNTSQALEQIDPNAFEASDEEEYEEESEEAEDLEEDDELEDLDDYDLDEEDDEEEDE